MVDSRQKQRSGQNSPPKKYLKNSWKLCHTSVALMHIHIVNDVCRYSVLYKCTQYRNTMVCLPCTYCTWNKRLVMKQRLNFWETGALQSIVLSYVLKCHLNIFVNLNKVNQDWWNDFLCYLVPAKLVSNCLKSRGYVTNIRLLILTRCEIGLLFWAKAPVNLNVIGSSGLFASRGGKFEVWYELFLKLTYLDRCVCAMCIMQSILKLEFMTFQSFIASCMLSQPKQKSTTNYRQPTIDNQKTGTKGGHADFFLVRKS
jgi:hypothetical protein